MKYLLTILLALQVLAARSQTCNALYSFSAYFEKVYFHNQSSLSNAHYYWNFGDGTASNAKDPIHLFPENGSYLVTLYVRDTLTNCSDFYEQWFNATKNSTESCSPFLNDSIYFSGGSWFIKLLDNSTNCMSNKWYSTFHMNNSINSTFSLGNGTIAGNFLSRIVCQTSGDYRAAFKTTPHNFNRAKNYNACSANFEFKVLSEDAGGQKILFTAMNKAAVGYTWTIIGMGSPIYGYSDTISQYFIGDTSLAIPGPPWHILLKINEGNCVDSIWQSVNIRKISSTIVGLKENTLNDINIEVFPNPAKDKLQLQWENGSIALDDLSISNLLGEIVFLQDKPKNEIDISSLKSGIYFLILSSGDEKKAFKFIKE